MPVEFLSSEQEKRYGCYNGEPSTQQLAKYFYLDDLDLQLIKKRRGNHNRLGLALQLCTVRFLGTFLTDPTDVPDLVINYLMSQLGQLDANCLEQYRNSETKWEHTALIKQRYGYREFHSQPEHWKLVCWLYQRSTLSPESPSVLFDLTTARLAERKILLPGVSVLARLVASVRERSANRLFRVLSSLPSPKQVGTLEKLLLIPEKARYSTLDRLRHSPTRVNAKSMLAAINRLSEIRSFGISDIDLSKIPPTRVKYLARLGAASRSAAIARMPDNKRIATLLAFIHLLEYTATDDVIDLFDLLVKGLLSKSKREGEQQRLRTLKDLDAAALKLTEAVEVLIDTEYEDINVRIEAFARVSQSQLALAVAKVKSLARPEEDEYYDLLLSRWRGVRIFLPSLLSQIEFSSTENAAHILYALLFLRSIEGQNRPDMSAAPLEVITKGWTRYCILPNGTIDRKAYTFCVLQSLRSALRRRDVFVAKSQRYCDPRAKLLSDEAWSSQRAGICRTLDLQPTFDSSLSILKQELDEAYRRTAANFENNTAIRIEHKDAKDNLVLTPLDKLVDPPSLVTLKRQVAAMLPKVDLPEVLLEINARTEFTKEFTHLSQANSRVEDLHISICAVLLAQACNIGLEPLVRPELPALTRGRLSWVQQNYIRQETLVSANGRLVDTQAHIPLAQIWGGGEVASADGLRFTVPVRTINAAPNSKYFGVGKGITYYNFTSDQFTGFHGIVIPGTLRDSLFLLSGLLEQSTLLQPVEIMTDTAGYSDVVFGLFWLLGYRFSPRIADIGEARFWRIDNSAHYGALDGLTKNKINTDLIANNWDDILRVAGSLKLGVVGATDLMRSLQRGNQPSTLAKAIGELGRIIKTLYLLSYIDDETYRRRILTQINRGESRHSLSRKVFHGQRGEIYQRYREGQEDQLGALGLVVNVIVLWNTYYMDAAVNELSCLGQATNREDIARLSPLGRKHINMLGRYYFLLAEPILKGELRPLRDPYAREEFDDLL
ncbi:MAG: Tn3 family transposase [Nostoc sp. ChiSLP01]|nr:Tn3 family transposase [Nostoc sp. CmiSLP01]MDZ8286400.1 Tn3 family transposase [Nostoc sp. ChiSLP01]